MSYGNKQNDFAQICPEDAWGLNTELINPCEKAHFSILKILRRVN